MATPLADRLTPDEKEEMRSRYRAYLEMAQYHIEKMNESRNAKCLHIHDKMRINYINRIDLMEQIFGKELFNTTEQ